MARSPHRRTRLRRVLAAIAIVIVLLFVVALASTHWLDTMGAEPGGERLARIERSPNYRDGAFRNPDATNTTPEGGTVQMLRRWLAGKEQRVPPFAIQIVSLRRDDYDLAHESG